MIINGQITKTFLGRVKEGLTFRIDIKYSEGTVSYGNVTLEEVLPGGIIAPTLLTGTIVAKLPLVLDKSSWEELVGTPVRLFLEEVKGELRVGKVGHIYEEKWFCLKEEIEAYNKYVQRARNEEIEEPSPEDIPGPDTEPEEYPYSEFWG